MVGTHMLRGLAVATLVACAFVGNAEAQIIGLSEHDIDLTKPKDALGKVRWDDTDLFRLGEKGLGRISNPAGTRDVTLRTTQPITLGTWWRPTDNASIQATITWAGEHAGAMPGAMYVSYSCGAASWSEWQLVPETRASKTKTTRVHNTVLQIPRDVRKRYWRQLREYAKQDVPWTSDEEAFVIWHRERHPTAFTKSRPFIGYLRFKYETEVPHGTYLTGMAFDTTWVVSGLSSIPSKAVEAIQEKRRDQPWSWRANGSHESSEGSTALKADERAVHEAALRYLIAQAEREGQARGSTKPYERIVLRPVTAGVMDLITLPKSSFKDLRSYFGKLDRSLATSFQLRSRRSTPLPMGLDPGLEVVYVSTERHLRMRLPQGGYNWKRHHSLWPGSFGRVSLSTPGYSDDRAQALVHVGRMYGHLAGYGTLVHLEKRQGTWHVVETRRTWVS